MESRWEIIPSAFFLHKPVDKVHLKVYYIIKNRARQPKGDKMKYALIVISKDGTRGTGTFYYSDFYQAKMAFDEHAFYGWNDIEVMYLKDAFKEKTICKFEGGVRR